MKAAIRLLLVLALVAPAMAFAQSTTTPTTPAPTCRIYAAATNVGYNTRVRIDWTTTNAQSGYLTEVGTIGPKGYAYVVPGKSTTYTASFTGKGGTAVCRAAIIVSSSNSSGSDGGTTGAVGGGGSPAVPAGQPGNNVPVTTATSPLDTNGSINGNTITVGESVDINGNPVPTTGSVSTGQAVTQNSSGGALPVAPNIAPASGPGGGGWLGGIVPQECRSGKTVINGKTVDNAVANCDMCALGQMVQNLINFLIGLTIPIAALLFAWAGILFFSSRGVPDQINRAKKIFKSVVIGFILVIAAWTLVNTVMNMLVKGPNFRNWSWSSLNCSATRILRQQQITRTISDYLNSSLPGLSTYTAPVGGSSYQCTTGVLINGDCLNPESGAFMSKPVLVDSRNSGGALGCSQYGDGYTVAGNQCVSMEYPDISVGPPLRAGELTDAQEEKLIDECSADVTESCDKLLAYAAVTSGNAIAGVRQWDTQVANACIAASMGDCKVVQAIMANESGGNCTLTSSAGAVGCMQLMPTTACGVDPSIPGCSSCTRWEHNKSSQCSQVVQSLISDPNLNIKVGTQELSRLYNKYGGDLTKVAAAYNGGDKANVCGSGCQSACGGTVNAAWQCTAFAGYKETRNYVVKVNNTFGKL